MKYLFALFGFIFLLFLGFFFTAKSELDDSRAVRRYVESKGAAPIPKSWRGKIGKGI